MLNVITYRLNQFSALALYNCFNMFSFLTKNFFLHASRIIWRAMSTLASFAHHEEPHNVSVACSTPLYGGMLCNPLGLTQVSCLHASALKLIQIQSGFNPHLWWPRGSLQVQVHILDSVSHIVQDRTPDSRILQ